LFFCGRVEEICFYSIFIVVVVSEIRMTRYLIFDARFRIRASSSSILAARQRFVRSMSIQWMSNVRDVLSTPIVLICWVVFPVPLALHAICALILRAS
jgi:hypothetical protein